MFMRVQRRQRIIEPNLPLETGCSSEEENDNLANFKLRRELEKVAFDPTKSNLESMDEETRALLLGAVRVPIAKEERNDIESVILAPAII